MPEIDISRLVHNSTIINTSEVQLNYYTYLYGIPVLSAMLEEPAGKIFFATDDILLELFYNGKISLQGLFDQSIVPVCIIQQDDLLRHYLKKDLTIKLKQGNNLIHQFAAP